MEGLRARGIDEALNDEGRRMNANLNLVCCDDMLLLLIVVILTS